MTAIDDARASYDILSIIGTNKRKTLCPLPGHVHHANTPSFSVFWRVGVQYWKCHGSCDREGDVVDLVGELRVPGYSRHNPDHVRQALTLLSDRFQAAPPKVEKEVVLGGGEWRNFLPPSDEVVAYAKSRGLTDETIAQVQDRVVAAVHDHAQLRERQADGHQAPPDCGRRAAVLLAQRFAAGTVQLRRGLPFDISGPDHKRRDPLHDPRPTQFQSLRPDRWGGELVQERGLAHRPGAVSQDHRRRQR